MEINKLIGVLAPDPVACTGPGHGYNKLTDSTAEYVPGSLISTDDNKNRYGTDLIPSRITCR
jgi:hypothetical protein